VAQLHTFQVTFQLSEVFDDIIIEIPLLFRMPELWGPDAEDFKPDRWFNEDGQLQQPSPFSGFIPLYQL
jgi:hypothetical protein